MKKTLSWLIIILVVCGAVYWVFRSPANIRGTRLFSSFKSQNNPEKAARPVLAAPSGDIILTIATSSEDMERGLGNRDSLPENEGMLFEFVAPGSYSFWMKDMKFPLDIVWIDSQKKVIKVDSTISPETYPDVFVPPSDVLYVLEINSGASQKYGLVEGVVVNF